MGNQPISRRYVKGKRRFNQSTLVGAWFVGAWLAKPLHKGFGLIPATCPQLKRGQKKVRTIFF